MYLNKQLPSLRAAPYILTRVRVRVRSAVASDIGGVKTLLWMTRLFQA